MLAIKKQVVKNLFSVWKYIAVVVNTISSTHSWFSGFVYNNCWWFLFDVYTYVTWWKITIKQKWPFTLKKKTNKKQQQKVNMYYETCLKLIHFIFWKKHDLCIQVIIHIYKKTTLFYNFLNVVFFEYNTCLTEVLNMLLGNKSYLMSHTVLCNLN